MIETKFDTSKVKKLTSKLLAHLQPETLVKAMGLRLLSDVDKQFRTEGSHFGKKWAPLKESTIARRRRGSSRILQDSGRLKTSFIDFGVKINRTQGIIGSMVEYASDHEFGMADRNLPQRKILPTQAQAKKILIPFLEASIEKVLTDARK